MTHPYQIVFVNAIDRIRRLTNTEEEAQASIERARKRWQTSMVGSLGDYLNIEADRLEATGAGGAFGPFRNIKVSG